VVSVRTRARAPGATQISYLKNYFLPNGKERKRRKRKREKKEGASVDIRMGYLFICSLSPLSLSHFVVVGVVEKPRTLIYGIKKK